MSDSIWFALLAVLAILLAVAAGIACVRWALRSLAQAAMARRQRQEAAASLSARLAAEHDQVMHSANQLMHSIRELGAVSGHFDVDRQRQLERSVKDRLTAAQRLNRRAQAMPTEPAALEALAPQEADRTLRFLTKACEDLYSIRATIERQLRQIQKQAAHLRARARGEAKTAYGPR